MATEVVSTIRSSGGDYSSLTAWESGEQRDLVTADEIAVAECYDDWPGGLDDALNIIGWTTSDTCYIEVRPAAGHGGGANPWSGFYLKSSLGGSSGVLRSSQSYTRFNGIHAWNTSTTAGDGVKLSAITYIDGCIARNDYASGAGFDLATTNSRIRNSVAIDCASHGFDAYRFGVLEISNCLAVSCAGVGFYMSGTGSSVVLKNNIAYLNGTQYSAVSWSSSSSNNAASNGSTTTPPGTSPYTSDVVSADFVDAANDDYHLASGSSLTTAGVNLYSDPDFKYDIDGDEYPSTGDWPIGFDYVAAGGGVSGTGDLVGAGSQVVGTGTRSVTGTGALEGQGAQVVGTATRTITGTGALVGQGSDVAGTGETGGAHTGTGDLVGAGSEIVGVGERTVTGTGALVAQGSAVAGVGERTVIGSGDLVGAGAEVSGSGAIGGITTGTGDLVGAGSEVVGTGLRTVTGSGALVAQGSAVTGTGERTVTGAGALVGSGSEIVGAGVGGDVTTGAGALVGAGSAVTGTGTRTITGVGELVAAGSIIVGSGLRTITGSGALVGAGSEVVGSSAHQFVAGNTHRTWLLSPRGREWSLSRSN